MTLDADFHTHLAVTNAETPSVIRLRIESLKAEAFAQLLIDVWPQFHHHVESGTSMISINNRNIMFDHCRLRRSQTTIDRCHEAVFMRFLKHATPRGKQNAARGNTIKM